MKNKEKVSNMTQHPFVNMRRRLGKYDVNLKINVNVPETKTNILF